MRKDLDTEKVDNSKQKSEHSTKRRQKKPTTSTKSAKRSKGEVATNAKETENESHSRKVPCSPSEDHSVEAAGALTKKLTLTFYYQRHATTNLKY